MSRKTLRICFGASEQSKIAFLAVIQIRQEANKSRDFLIATTLSLLSIVEFIMKIMSYVRVYKFKLLTKEVLSTIANEA